MVDCCEDRTAARRFQRLTTIDSELIRRANATDESARPTPEKRRTTPVNLPASVRETEPAVPR